MGLERLVYPPRAAPLVLRFSCCPRESALNASAADGDSSMADEACRSQRGATFEVARRALESQLRLHSAGRDESLELLCLKSHQGVCHVLIVERDVSSITPKADDT